MLLRLLPPVRALTKLAEAEVAVSDEWAHAARFGECKRLAEVALAALRIEPVGIRRDVAEEVLRMRHKSWLTRRKLYRTVTQAPRLVKPAEQETGPTE